MSATACSVGGGGSGLTCTGLAGVDEAGATEGYVELAEAADILIFHLPVPETFDDAGAAADFDINLDLHEQEATNTVNVDIRIFQYGDTTPIVTDAFTIVSGTARGWTAMDTASTGFGDDAELDPDDELVIEVTVNTDDDDVRVYGARIKYRVGIDGTQ